MAVIFMFNRRGGDPIGMHRIGKFLYQNSEMQVQCLRKMPGSGLIYIHWYLLLRGCILPYPCIRSGTTCSFTVSLWRVVHRKSTKQGILNPGGGVTKLKDGGEQHFFSWKCMSTTPAIIFKIFL